MADYLRYTKTNYFTVTNENDLRNLVNKIECDDTIRLHTKEQDCIKLFSLETDGNFKGLIDKETGDTSWDKMCEEFSELLEGDSCLIMFDIGDDKFNRIDKAIIITQNGYIVKSLQTMVDSIKQDMLKTLE